MLDWVLSFIPLWVWVVLAVAAAFTAWRLLGLRGALAALGAAAGVLAYRMGLKAGGANALKKQKQADEKAVKDHERIAEESERMSDADLDRANSAWLRDRGK